MKVKLKRINKRAVKRSSMIIMLIFLVFICIVASCFAFYEQYRYVKLSEDYARLNEKYNTIRGEYVSMAENYEGKLGEYNRKLRNNEIYLNMTLMTVQQCYRQVEGVFYFCGLYSKLLSESALYCSAPSDNLAANIDREYRMLKDFSGYSPPAFSRSLHRVLSEGSCEAVRGMLLGYDQKAFSSAMRESFKKGNKTISLLANYTPTEEELMKVASLQLSSAP